MARDDDDDTLEILREGIDQGLRRMTRRTTTVSRRRTRAELGSGYGCL